ncbi:MAG: DUF1801 domain-containing protein [Balneola sp.]|tara:strand:+ start:116366 stop:116785 length:420 start_codon:yes stop_codon:yes gene_type:complete
MKLTTDPRTKEVFKNYPKSVQTQMYQLRELVLSTAREIEGLDKLEETLKWGEPSYLTKHGSTVRMDWKEKKPDQYAMYFKCTSKLVPTFKELYPDVFTFEGDRAIIFKLDERIPDNELKHCVKLALTYHKVKHLPLLGA